MVCYSEGTQPRLNHGDYTGAEEEEDAMESSVHPSFKRSARAHRAGVKCSPVGSALLVIRGDWASSQPPVAVCFAGPKRHSLTMAVAVASRMGGANRFTRWNRFDSGAFDRSLRRSTGFHHRAQEKARRRFYLTLRAGACTITRRCMHVQMGGVGEKQRCLRQGRRPSQGVGCRSSFGQTRSFFRR